MQTSLSSTRLLPRIRKMDTPTKIFVFAVVGATWAVILFGVVLSLVKGTLVIDAGVLGPVISVVVTVFVSLASARMGVSIHTNAQQNQQNGQP
jgi:hypothetical protein